MNLENLINEIVKATTEKSTDTMEVVKELPLETKEGTNEVNETSGDISKNANAEFLEERAHLHAKIIGKDINGRNVSDWCGCNNACTHTAS